MDGQPHYSIPGESANGKSAYSFSAASVPSVTATPANNDSDLCHTSCAVMTTGSSDKLDTGATSSDIDSQASSSKPITHIPGLSLIHDGLKTLQLPNVGPAHVETAPERQNMDYNTSTEPRHEIINDAEDGLNQEAQKSDPVSGDAVGIENVGKQLSENAAKQTQCASREHMEQVSSTVVEKLSGSSQDAKQQDESREWETDSSPYESSSDTSTTDSDDSDEDSSDYPILSPEEQARILMATENDSDDEGPKNKSDGYIKSTNELLEEAPPIPDTTITSDMKIIHLGQVQSIVENALLIEANVSGEYQVLESGSLLCTENREIIGVVSETLGRVEKPLYTVLYVNAAAIEERGLIKGRQIYYVEDHSTFVFTQPLKGLKGSDASNFHDEEVGDEEIEFSDDEAEAEYKRRLKQKRQERKNARGESSLAKTKREPHGPSKLSQVEHSIHNDGHDDGYTPLSRPKNLHEMMGHQEAPVEMSERPIRGAGFRVKSRGGILGHGGGRGRGTGPNEHHPLYDRREYHQQTTPSEIPNQHPTYDQPALEHIQLNAGSAVQFAQYAQFMQQQRPYVQGSPLTQFSSTMPSSHSYQQLNQYQQAPPNIHVNPLFLAALQRQQQQQQQQQQLQRVLQQPQQPTQPQGWTVSPQAQGQTVNTDQLRAQLDLLKQLSGGNSGSRPT